MQPTVLVRSRIFDGLTDAERDLAGTTLYTVSRTLTKWESLGIIESRKRFLLLRAPEQLQHVGGADED